MLPLVLIPPSSFIAKLVISAEGAAVELCTRTTEKEIGSEEDLRTEVSALWQRMVAQEKNFKSS